ncbi:MAG TPA: hypothetical protein VHX40_01345, partial [Acidimicrobiales bacterium]|nr:hypothetical protein [Acidimicrobiales bacterium]
MPEVQNRRPESVPESASEAKRPPTGRALLRELPRRDRVLVEGGAQLHLLVLACTDEDTTAVDLS